MKKKKNQKRLMIAILLTHSVDFEYTNKQNPEVYYDDGEVGSDIRLVNWMNP